MKKLNYLLLGAAGLLLASCSNEDLVAPAPAGDGNVNIKVSIPTEVATRALSDGLTARLLNYVVYDTDNDNNVVLNGIAEFNTQEPGQISTTVSFNLANGKTYNIAFFAQSDLSYQDEVYTFTPATSVITADYSKMTSDGNLNDTYDCFANTTGEFTVGTGSNNITCILYRPVAQINWGTLDIKADNENSGATQSGAIASLFGPNGEYIRTNLTIEGVYTQFNILNNNVVENTQQNITLSNNNDGFVAPSTIPTNIFPFGPQNNTNPYTWIAMNYVLAPTTSDVFNVTLNISDEGNTNATSYQNDVDVASVPLQANYQTNIYGNLLSNNVTVNVIKSADWATGSPNNVALWDGATTSQPSFDVATNTYTINNPSEWIWLTQNVSANSTTKGSVNANVVLTADLDFAGNDVQGVYYNGTFDGQGHTIRNLNVIAKSSYAAGFFGNDIAAGSGTVTIQNLNFEGVNISNNNASYGWIGVVVGDIQSNNFVISNVNVNNATLNGVSNVGGLVGFVASNRTLNVTGCSVTNSTISNSPVENVSGNVCGLVGDAAGTVTFGAGNSLENVTINGYWTSTTNVESINAVAATNYEYNVGTINGIGDVATTNVTVNKFEVTTGATVNGYNYNTLEEALQEITDGTPATINLGLGDFDLPTTFGENQNITFTGIGQNYTVLQTPLAYNATEGATLSFSNLSIQAVEAQGKSMMFTGAKSQEFKNVTFIGEMHTYGGNATFTDCIFTSQAESLNPTGRYGLWIDSKTPDSNTTVTNCQFDNYLAKGILVYDQASSVSNQTNAGDITISGCTFYASAPYKTNAAIELHSENYASAGKLTIENTTFNSNYTALWSENANGVATKYFTVYVNGQEVQQGTDGNN